MLDKKCLLLVGIIASFFLDSYGQSAGKKLTHQESLWTAYIHQTRLTEKLGLWTDIHIRLTDNYTGRMGTEIYRFGGVYYINTNTRLALGYANIRHHTSKGERFIPEHRPWQQIQWFRKGNRYSTMQWLRLEQRFLQVLDHGNPTDDYRFNLRLRYNFNHFYPINRKEISPGAIFTVFNNELHLNAPNENVSRFFDQNRFFLGMGYQMSPRVNMQVGYMNLTQRIAGTDMYSMNHTLRIFLFHNLDFSKKP